MDSIAVLALATALEYEFEPLRKWLESLAESSDEDARKEARKVQKEILVMLVGLGGVFYSRNALWSSMATAYLEGVAHTSGRAVRNTGKLMRAEKAFAAVHESTILDGAVNSVADASKAFEARANVVSRIVQAQILQRTRDDLSIVEGGEPEGIREMASVLAKNLETLTLNEHVQLHATVNTQQAQGFGNLSAQQTEDWLRRHQYQELYRAENRHEWRPWPEIWSEQGGALYKVGPSDYPEGRMVAEVNSKIWEDISDFGTPYAPFKYGSGMDVKPVPADELQRLGLLPKQLRPRKRDFNASIKFSAVLDPDLKAALLNRMGPLVETIK